MSTPAIRPGAVPAAGLARVALWLLASLAAGWLPAAAGCASGQSCQKDGRGCPPGYFCDPDDRLCK